MKSIVAVLLCCGLMGGCSTVSHRPSNKLTVKITSVLGLIGKTSDFRVFVDGHLVGNYAPDGCVLELPVGTHSIAVELPAAYARRELPNAGVEVRTYTLRGKERVRLLEGASQQVLLFNEHNLKSREVSK